MLRKMWTVNTGDINGNRNSNKWCSNRNQKACAKNKRPYHNWKDVTTVLRRLEISCDDVQVPAEDKLIANF